MPPEKLADTLRECVVGLKLVIDSLEPIGHDIGTLLGMLRYRLAERLETSGIRVIWSVDDLPSLDWLEPPEALQLLRIFQETLTNILKHAQATEVRITAHLDSDRRDCAGVLVEIADNGIGFDTDNVSLGHGLNNMQERAMLLGTTIEIQAVHGQGVRVRLWLPITVPSPPRSLHDLSLCALNTGFPHISSMTTAPVSPVYGTDTLHGICDYHHHLSTACLTRVEVRQYKQTRANN